MKFVLTEAALEDLRSIRSYTLEHWGKQQEEHYIHSLLLLLSPMFKGVGADSAKVFERRLC